MRVQVDERFGCRSDDIVGETRFSSQNAHKRRYFHDMNQRLEHIWLGRGHADPDEHDDESWIDGHFGVVYDLVLVLFDVALGDFFPFLSVALFEIL